MQSRADQRVQLSFAPDSTAGRVLALLRMQPGPIFLVGGVVRDLLLDRTSVDLDVAVPQDAAALARRLADQLGGAFVLLDAAHDIARVVLSEPSGTTFYVDCTAWRGGSLEEDLRLRDFTINALALDLKQPDVGVIDVTGGLRDLERRLIRLTSERALVDDPLRGLRAVRLLAELAPWGFRLADETTRLVRQYAGWLTLSAAERIRDELVRILDASNPGRWLRLLVELGQLRVVLPEADDLRGVSQSPPHRWDVFEHTVRALDHVAHLQRWLASAQRETDDEWSKALRAALGPQRTALQAHFQQSEAATRDRAQMLRWAALCHDWGKPATWQEVVRADGTTRIRFLGHDKVGARLTREALGRLRFNEAEARRVSAIVAHHMRPLLLARSRTGPGRRAIYRYFKSTGDAGVDVAVLSLADAWATGGPTALGPQWGRLQRTVYRLLDSFFAQPQEAVLPPPLLTGHDLMTAFGLTPGPLVGQLLEQVAEAQAVGEVQSKEQALAYARRLLAEPAKTAGFLADG